MTAEIIAYTIVIVWGIATTIYGLYLSRKNNERYNKKIVELLEEINKNVKNNKLRNSGRANHKHREGTEWI